MAKKPALIEGPAPIGIKVEHRIGRRDCAMDHGQPTAWLVSFTTEWDGLIFFPLCEACFAKLRQCVKDPVPSPRNPYVFTDVVAAHGTEAPLGLSIQQRNDLRGECTMKHAALPTWILAIELPVSLTVLSLCEACFAKVRRIITQDYPPLSKKLAD